MERYFCRDKKDYCDKELACRGCEFAKGSGVINGVYVEDVLSTLFGDDYNLDRLKELVKADREGRIKILPKSTENTCGTCENFSRIEGTKRGHCRLKPLVNSQYGIRYNIPFEPSQSRKACKQYESALKAMKESENDG